MTAVRVCHVMSADLWAGAEVQLATAGAYLARRPDIDVTAVLFNDGRLARELTRAGVPVTIVDEARHNPLRILLALTRILRAHPVDVLHTHRYSDTVLGVAAARLAGVPAVVRTVHGRGEPMRGWDRAKFAVYSALERLALRTSVQRIVAVSTSVAGSLRAAGCHPSTIVQIPNGVDLGRARPGRSREEVRRALGVDPVAPLIGTVGRLCPVKGHADFLRAGRQIVAQQPEARLLLVGDGPLRRELESMAAGLRIDGACIFAGARADVFDLMAAMDVFVLPSLDEGIPLALLEAMAIGVPVVATSVGGIPEIVTHRTTGLLVPPRDDRALARACLEVARDRALAGTLGAGARALVARTFSQERNGEALVDVYRAVTAGARAAGRSTRRPSAAAIAAGLLWHGAGRVRNVLARAQARRRMRRTRRNPAPLAAALSSARSILVVCYGNIIRSPFAAAMLARALEPAGRVRVSSAGLAATPDTPSPETAVRVAAARAIDLGAHRAAPVTREAVAGSDLILVMDASQLVLLHRRFPEARGRAFLLTSLAPHTPLEVRDPVDGDAPRFEACFDHIAASVRPIAQRLHR